MNPLLKVFLMSLLSVVALFLITKLMGHKQVSQLDFFDYINGITIGSIAAELSTDLETPWNGLIALGVWGFTSVILSLLTHKFPRIRKYINGTPSILMNNGKLYRKNLKKAKLDLSEFLLLCRGQGYFDLAEIQTAVFEHNGKLSVLPTSLSRPASPKDLNLQPSPSHIGTEVIMDGRIMGENLTRVGRDPKWLSAQMKQQGYRSEKEIFLGIYRPENDQLSLYPPN